MSFCFHLLDVIPLCVHVILSLGGCVLFILKFLIWCMHAYREDIFEAEGICDFHEIPAVELQIGNIFWCYVKYFFL